MHEPGVDGRVHVAAQLAACCTGAGVAACIDAAVLELRGPCHDVVAAARTRLPRGWWALVTPHRAVALLDWDARELHRVITALERTAPDIAALDMSPAFGTVVVAGPAAGAVIGAAQAKLDDPLLEAADGDAWFLVVRKDRAVDTRRALLEAGRDLGAIAVGEHAIRLHRIACQFQGSPPPVAMPPTGEPIL